MDQGLCDDIRVVERDAKLVSHVDADDGSVLLSPTFQGLVEGHLFAGNVLEVAQERQGPWSRRKTISFLSQVVRHEAQEDSHYQGLSCRSSWGSSTDILDDCECSVKGVCHSCQQV